MTHPVRGPVAVVRPVTQVTGLTTGLTGQDRGRRLPTALQGELKAVFISLQYDCL